MVSTLVIKKDRLEIPDNWPVVNNEVENRYTIPESSVAERLLGHILRIYPDGGNYYIFLASVNQGTYKNESADSQNSNLGQAMYSLPREYNNRIFPSIKLGSRYTSNK